MVDALLERAILVVVVLLASGLTLEVAGRVVGAIPVYKASETVADALLVNTFLDESALLNFADNPVRFIFYNVLGTMNADAVLEPRLHLHFSVVD